MFPSIEPAVLELSNGAFTEIKSTMIKQNLLNRKYLKQSVDIDMTGLIVSSRGHLDNVDLRIEITARLIREYLLRECDNSRNVHHLSLWCSWDEMTEVSRKPYIDYASAGLRTAIPCILRDCELTDAQLRFILFIVTTMRNIRLPYPVAE